MCCTLAAVTSGYVQKNQALIQKRSCIYQKSYEHIKMKTILKLNSTKQALWMTGEWRENNCRWCRKSCFIQSASVTLEPDSTPVESPCDVLPVLKDPQGGVSCCACLLRVGSQKDERVSLGSSTRVGAHTPRHWGLSWVEGAAAWPERLNEWVGGCHFVCCHWYLVHKRSGD